MRPGRCSTTSRRRTTARRRPATGRGTTRRSMKSRTVPPPARSPPWIPARSPTGTPIPRWPHRHAPVWATIWAWWPLPPNMGFLDVHYRVGVLNIFQWRGPDAIQLSGYGNGTAGREHFGVQKRCAGCDESSRTGLVTARSSIGVQRQSEDVHNRAVGVVIDADDSSAPDDHRSTCAVGVGLDLAVGYWLGLSPKIA